MACSEACIHSSKSKHSWSLNFVSVLSGRSYGLLAIIRRRTKSANHPSSSVLRILFKIFCGLAGEYIYIYI